MKVYMVCDMEGTAGVSIWDQVLGDGPRYQEARRWMTEEVNAAARGAFEAGAELVVVNDAHYSGHNLVVDVLDPRIEHIMGYSAKTWADLDSSFDVLFHVGAHAKAGTPNACLRHTWSPSSWTDVRINGQSVGEIGLVAAGAADFDVPCVFISGGEAACAEAAALIPGIHQAPVKKGLGWQSARSLSLRSARERIQHAAREARIQVDHIAPLVLGPRPAVIEIIQLKEDRGPLYASQCEAEQLLAEPRVVRRATAQTVSEAFYKAMKAPAEPWEDPQ